LTLVAFLTYGVPTQLGTREIGSREAKVSSVMEHQSRIAALALALTVVILLSSPDPLKHIDLSYLHQATRELGER
jgi:hypothetical protein